MMPLIYLLSFVLALAVSAGLGEWIFRFLAARETVDAPNARSSHCEPTVRGGGLAIQLAIVGGIGVLAAGKDGRGLVLLPPLFVLTLISLLDDLKDVPALARLGAHVMAAIMGLALLRWPPLVLEGPAGLHLAVPLGIGVVLSVLWLAGMINTFNFMDGINGHAAIQTVITACASALLVARSGQTGWMLPALYLVVAGAAAGFLPHNFPRARMFMGDVGSVPLGAVLGLLALWSARDAGGALLLPLAMLQFNFILDTAVTLGRRAWRGNNLSEAHCEHLYERFAAATGSHARVVLAENSVLLPVAVLLTFYASASAGTRGLMLASVMMTWAIYYAAVEMYCRRRVCARRAD